MHYLLKGCRSSPSFPNVRLAKLDVSSWQHVSDVTDRADDVSPWVKQTWGLSRLHLASADRDISNMPGGVVQVSHVRVRGV